MVRALCLWAAVLFVAPTADGFAQERFSVPPQGAPTAAVPSYRLKPADYQPPAGAAPGAFRRMIQPFGGWTLICDENVKARTRICNASQTLVDVDGQLVFSWSLAATDGGEPVFVLRAAHSPDFTGDIKLSLKNPTTNPIKTRVSKCDASLCIGFLAVDDNLKRAIAAGANVHVLMAGTTNAGNIELNTSLKDLAAAIASIK